MGLSPRVLGLITSFFGMLSRSDHLRVIYSLGKNGGGISRVVRTANLKRTGMSGRLGVLTRTKVIDHRRRNMYICCRVTGTFIFRLYRLICASLTMRLRRRSRGVTDLNTFQRPVS